MLFKGDKWLSSNNRMNSIKSLLGEAALFCEIKHIMGMSNSYYSELIQLNHVDSHKACGKVGEDTIQ